MMDISSVKKNQQSNFVLPFPTSFYNSNQSSEVPLRIFCFINEDITKKTFKSSFLLWLTLKMIYMWRFTINQ